MAEMTEQEQPAVRVRELLRRAESAALATSLARGGAAAPYASLVLTACDQQGRPLLLLSDLADHSKNLAADPRLSLLVDGHRPDQEPLTGARVSVQGRCAPGDGDPELLARFLRRHPSAEVYAGFADFKLYRVEVESAHLVAGFGQIHWLSAEDGLCIEAAPELAAAEADIVAHMNEDHADALDLIAGTLLGLDGSGWRLLGVDPEGFDLRRGRSLARGGFAETVVDAETCRAELVRLTKAARQHAAAQT